MNQIRFGNNEVLKTLTKTLTFVDADADANADAWGSTIALPERCSGELTNARQSQKTDTETASTNYDVSSSEQL